MDPQPDPHAGGLRVQRVPEAKPARPAAVEQVEDGRFADPL